LKKKIVLFVGSGISFATDLPNTQFITDRLLNGSWSSHTDNRFYRESNKQAASDPWVPRLQSFLKLLKSRADRYAALKSALLASYEDLYFICEQIDNEESGEIVNPVVQPFVEQLRAEVLPLCHPFDPPLGHISINLKTLARQSLSFMESVVESMVATSSPPKGLNLISELARESDLELTIASLNHDTLIERIFEKEGILFTDGFGTAGRRLLMVRRA
jgi:hypothetical protein